MHRAEQYRFLGTWDGFTRKTPLHTGQTSGTFLVGLLLVKVPMQALEQQTRRSISRGLTKNAVLQIGHILSLPIVR
jgi:hypothetical protein